MIHKVQYVPNLAHCLLTVGQLLLTGFLVVFTNEGCYIKDEKTGQQVAKISMASNQMFPLEVAKLDYLNLLTQHQTSTTLWHLRYGHLNIKGMQLLSGKGMVKGLSELINLHFVKVVSLASKYEDRFQQKEHGGPQTNSHSFMQMFVVPCKHNH